MTNTRRYWINTYWINKWMYEWICPSSPALYRRVRAKPSSAALKSQTLHYRTYLGDLAMPLRVRACVCWGGWELDSLLCFIMCWSFEKGSSPRTIQAFIKVLQQTDSSNNNLKWNEAEYLMWPLSWGISAKAPGFGKQDGAPPGKRQSRDFQNLCGGSRPGGPSPARPASTRRLPKTSLL